MKEEMRVQRRVLLQDWGFSGGCSTMRLFPLSFSISSECTFKCLSTCQHLLLVLKQSRACEKPVVDSDEILGGCSGTDTDKRDPYAHPYHGISSTPFLGGVLNTAGFYLLSGSISTNFLSVVRGRLLSSGPMGQRGAGRTWREAHEFMWTLLGQLDPGDNVMCRV